MKSLKKVYSSIYKKYQLKEAYNNLFELRDANIIDTNNIQDKIDANSNESSIRLEDLILEVYSYIYNKQK